MFTQFVSFSASVFRFEHNSTNNNKISFVKQCHGTECINLIKTFSFRSINPFSFRLCIHCFVSERGEHTVRIHNLLLYTKYAFLLRVYINNWICYISSAYSIVRYEWIMEIRLPLFTLYLLYTIVDSKSDFFCAKKWK